MKKILILANSSGGLYDFRGDLIIELKKNYDIAASTPYNGKIDELKGIGCKLIETNIDRRGINPFRDFKLLIDYYKIFKSEKPDCVITYTIKPNIYGSIICHLMNIHCDVNITGLGTAFQKKGLLRELVVVMYKIALKKANTVFFENIENKNIFVDEKIVKEKQCCLLNGAGVNLEHFGISEYPHNEYTRFLFIGRIMKEKGVDELFEAMQRLNKNSIKCSLDVLGNFDEDYSVIIKKYEEEGWLNYHGYQEDVRPYIAKADCFVLPSWHEGMANTNLECAASGRPVITSNIHGCMESVENGITGFLCEKQNSEDLYKVMKKFIGLSYEEKKNMGLAGRNRMKKLFDKKYVVERTISNL